MTTYAWPSAWVPTNQRLVVAANQEASRSPLSGYVQTYTHPGSRWGWVLDFPAHLGPQRAAFEAFLVKLNGREHRVSLWDHKRPQPRGTCNLSGVTLASTAAQFATSLSLTGCGAAKTLLAGDWLKVGTQQLVMVTDDATADGAGAMTVTIRHMLRASAASGTGITLDRPTALYILTDSRQELPRVPGQSMPGLTLEFEEVFA